MRKLTFSLALIAAGAFSACSAGDDGTNDGKGEVATASESITGACADFTFGYPCDPDGATGPLLECQGVCWLDTSGQAACVKIADAGITTMDGKICGNQFGSGATACANTCLSGACVAITAKTGTACRLFGGSPCSGACTATGQCGPVANQCVVNRVGCIVNACNMNNSAQCQSVNLLKGTACTDSNACTLTDTCDGAGKCAPGTAKSCDDGNVCTTDTCNPNNGACIGVPNTNSCSDGNACTGNDTCANGVCTAGAALNCDDNNACTTDSCNTSTGCTHVAKDCNDNDACTTDGCDSTSGNCTHAAVNCDDNNACTTDTCAAASGCAHTPISGCGTGGTGGTGGATGGAGGASGGTGGASGGAAGTGSGGVAGSASGGAAGAATGGAAGSATGGAAGSGTGGSSTGGGGSGGASTGGGGTGASATGGKDGGAGTGGGTGGKKSSSDSGDEGGCGCRVPNGDAPASSALFALAALGLALARRRR